jgi:curved DNA-binding protein
MSSVGAKDFYDVLGVSRTASTEEIRRAYRGLARKHHPDVDKSEGAEERFKEISEAYDALRDPESRERYDRRGQGFAQGFSPGGGTGRRAASGTGRRAASGTEGFESFGEGGFDDILEGLFGGRMNGFSMRGSDHEAVLELSLEEAAAGGKRRITLADGGSFEVEIPKGVSDGQRIRLAGQGGSGSSGGQAGDLLLRIKIRPHKVFRLVGRDLHVDLPVTPPEAVLGATVEVPTLSGTAKVRVPPGSSTGRKLRLRGEGMPATRGAPGDLLAAVKIMVPKNPSAKERKLYEELAKVSKFNPRKGQ